MGQAYDSVSDFSIFSNAVGVQNVSKTFHKLTQISVIQTLVFIVWVFYVLS